MSAKGRGIARERQMVKWYQDRGYVAFRSPASLGAADVVALRAGFAPRLVEVKATADGPYKTFGPAARARLSALAKEAGGVALLAWWPANKPLRLITELEWPEA